MNLDEAAQTFRELVSVIQALRTPVTGCPWDLEQTHHTLRPYLVEETYEVLDAVDRGDDRSFQEELGDLLLQVVLHAQLAEDRGAFSIMEVVRGITDKMVRRHPHVFGSVRVSSSAEVLRNWEQIKEAESQGKGSPAPDALGHVPESLPALLRAQRLSAKAARAHGAAASIADILNQVREQFAALEKEIRSREDGLPDVGATPLERKFGDVLFSLCQLARALGLSAEDSLRAFNKRFVDQFRNAEKMR